MSSQVSSTKKLLSAGALMASGTLISRILGFARVALIVFILGNATRQVDMLSIATSVPNALYILFAGGALNTVLVPQIVRAIKNDADGGEAYTNRIMTAFLLIVAVVAIIVTVAAPLVMWIYAGEAWRADDLASQYASMVSLAYLTLPQIFFYGVFFLLGQVLNARDRFGPMMWAPIANNVISIAVLTAYLIIWGTGDDHSGAFTSGQIWLLGLGTTLGIVTQSAVLVPYLRKVGFTFRPRFDLKGTGLGKTFSLTKWTIGFVLVNQLTFVVVTRLSTAATALAEDGGAGLAVYSNAHLVWILPHSLITVSLATAMLPNASRLAAAGDMTAVAAEATKTLRLSLVALVPATIGFVALASPIAALLFGNGRGSQDSQFVAVALVAFAVGLIPFTVQFICLRTYYAIENTRTPFFLQCIIAGVNVGGALLFVSLVGDPTFRAAALALAYSLAYVVGVIVSWRFLRRFVPALDGQALVLHIIRLLLGAGVGGAVAYFASEAILDAFPDSKLGPLLAVVAGLAIIAVLFALVGKLLHVRELGNLTDLVGSRFGRRTNSVVSAEPREADVEVPEAVTVLQQSVVADSATQDLMPDESEGTPMSYDPESELETRIRPAIVIPDDDAASGEASPTLGESGALLNTRYRLEEPLALRHGIETWRAHDLQLSRDVVAHIMPTDDTRIPQVLDAARTGATATDSRFLRVLDAVVLDDDGPIGGYVICEYAAGTSLTKLLTIHQLSSMEATWIVLELADALTALHAQGLFHEQLTPENIIITSNGAVRVVGFGVESVLSAMERPVSWSAKEDADVTALASLLYAMLSEHWPGGAAWGLPAAPIVGGSLVGPARLRAAVPASLDAICAAVLIDRAQTGAARISTASQLVAGLSAVMGNTDPSLQLEERVRGGGTTPRPDTPAPVSAMAATSIPSMRQQRPEPAGGGNATHVFAAHTNAATESDDAEVGVESDDERTTRRGPLLWIIVALVLAAIVVTWLALSNNGSTDEQAGAGATSTSSTAPEGPAGVLTIVSGTDFDPEADGGNAEENASQVGNVFDGDPATGWSTVQYHNRPDLGGLKPGVGVVLDLGEVRNISSVEVQFTEPGTTVELRVPAQADTGSAPMATQTDWAVVATQAQADATVTLTPTEASSARFVLVYLTELPEVTTARFQSEITEIVVTG
ncbi:MAG: murein biosynthesis integral membrane protein MurJ [Arachnia sp.]